MFFFSYSSFFSLALALARHSSLVGHSRHRRDLLVLERRAAAAQLIPVVAAAARAAAAAEAAARRGEVRVPAAVPAAPRGERLGPRDRRGEALGRLRAQPEGPELAVVGGGGGGEAGGADDSAEDRSGGPVFFFFFFFFLGGGGVKGRAAFCWKRRVRARGVRAKGRSETDDKQRGKTHLSLSHARACVRTHAHTRTHLSTALTSEGPPMFLKRTASAVATTCHLAATSAASAAAPPPRIACCCCCRACLALVRASRAAFSAAAFARAFSASASFFFSSCSLSLFSRASASCFEGVCAVIAGGRPRRGEAEDEDEEAEGVAAGAFLLADVFVGPGGGGGFAAVGFAGGGFEEGGGAFFAAALLSAPRRRSGAVAAVAASLLFLKKSKDKKGAAALSSLEFGSVVGVFSGAASTTFGEERTMDRARKAAAAEARCCCCRGGVGGGGGGGGGRADGEAWVSSKFAPPLALALHLFAQRDLSRRVSEIEKAALLDKGPDEMLIEERELEKSFAFWSIAFEHSGASEVLAQTLGGKKLKPRRKK